MCAVSHCNEWEGIELYWRTPTFEKERHVSTLLSMVGFGKLYSNCSFLLVLILVSCHSSWFTLITLWERISILVWDTCVNCQLSSITKMKLVKVFERFTDKAVPQSIRKSLEVWHLGCPFHSSSVWVTDNERPNDLFVRPRDFFLLLHIPSTEHYHSEAHSLTGVNWISRLCASLSS